MEKFLNDLLASFGSANRDCVYLSVTPGVGLEIIKIDPPIQIFMLHNIAKNIPQNDWEKSMTFAPFFKNN